jgi:hypothetical protein
MRKKETTTENQYITPPLGICVRWWKGKKFRDAKGNGSFNIDLYHRYLNAISQ